MRAKTAASIAAIVGSALVAGSPPAVADSLPPGSLGLVLGAISGTGKDASRLGYGYQFGGQAAWQPMTTEQRIGWSIKGSTLFGTHLSSDAARITGELLTLQMSLMLGIRVRPGVDPSRYLTLRVGAELLRANQEIPPDNERAFFGPVASIGLDQYAWGVLFNVDVRYGLIGDAPHEIALTVGVSLTGP